jgi:serine phosphatase RsbU (regulator of sigma subunit)/integral membrane sensor domain MASE1
VVWVVFLFGIFILSASSIMLRPENTTWSAWWPASGLAIGVASRFERRRIWRVAAAVGAVSVAASLVSGRELPLAVWAGVSIAAEVWIGAAVLRSQTDRRPRLETASDLYRLFVCAVVSAVTLGLFGGLIVAVLRGVDEYLPAVVASVPAHAAGVLLVAPLVIIRRGQSGSGGRGESVAIWITLVLILCVAFGFNVGLPIAFLASVPLTWGATRLAPRSAFWMMIVVAVATTAFSLSGRGPFAFGTLPADVTVLMLQLFNLSFAVVALTLIVITAQRHLLTETLFESESLFRAAFDFSAVGSAVVTKTETGPIVDQLNSAGRDLLGLRTGAPVEIAEHLSDDSLVVFSGVIGLYGKSGVNQWRGILTLRDDRSLQVLLSGLPGAFDDKDSFAIQFLDITDQLRAQRAVSQDLARAGEVQRALLPTDRTPLVGYEVAGACVPAKTVGGDFYDWYQTSDGLAFSLGDVMGKGVGAGMIAATTRAVLRSARFDDDVAVAVARAADTLNIEVAGVDSFTTLFHARLRSHDGTLDYVDAGHGLAIILRVNGTAHRITSTDLPLGIMDDTSWMTHTEVLHPGDALIAVSDGILDLYDGTLAALDHIAELARDADSPSDLAARVTQLAQQTAEPEDDNTILIIRRNV